LNLKAAMVASKKPISLAAAMMAAACPCAGLAQTPQAATPAPHPVPAGAIEQIVVTASRINLLGHASTASQGSITKKELELRPVYRVGQLLETVPGLVVSIHSGEGKAPQYLARGFNLDHGTDIANFVDDMPINRPSNTHGQGYSDLNFLIPETFAGLDYTKGPYYAEIGDFGSVVSDHLRLANDLPNQIILSAGTLGDERIAMTGTLHLTNGDTIAAAADISHLDGPFDPPNNFRKIATEIRYASGTATDGYSLTGMYYKGQGRFTTDQPQRAIDEGLIDRFGTLDPTDGQFSERESLDGHYAKSGDDWQFRISGYGIHSLQTLWNNFTHFLFDPINGDQEQQSEDRTTVGGETTFSYQTEIAGFENDIVVGVQGRHDDIYTDKRHTKDRQVLDYCESSIGFYSVGQTACNADSIQVADTGVFADVTTHWQPWLRTILGARQEFYNGTDRSLITGFKGVGSQALFQPKGSLVIGPWLQTELYISAGRGFHSDDARGVFQTLPLEGIPGLSHHTPFMAKSDGEEIGLRTTPLKNLNIQAALFEIEFASELIYDQDMGQDQAQAPSKRRGIEISAQYRPAPWIELNTDLAATKARFRTGNPESYGLNGLYIAEAPDFIGSFGAIIDHLGPWYGGAQWRILGAYPLNPDNLVRARGYSEINVDIGYTIAPRTKLQLSLYNITDQRANAFEYDYVTRLPGEPPGGVTSELQDRQVHPLEPLSARLMLTQGF
jgi:outer membrane receptor protein involved in Fe transport